MSLIRRAKTDPMAFAKLYEEHVQAVYHYLIVRIQNQKEAEDLTSNVWENVLRNIKNLNSNNTTVFRAWLFTITRNCFNKFLSEKIKNKKVDFEEESEKFMCEDPLPQEILKEKENASQIHVLINALPEEQRETLTLRYFSDLRNKEIAKILTVSEKTVASNLYRALQTLRDLWGKLQ